MLQDKDLTAYGWKQKEESEKKYAVERSEKTLNRFKVYGMILGGLTLIGIIEPMLIGVSCFLFGVILFCEFINWLMEV